MRTYRISNYTELIPYLDIDSLMSLYPDTEFTDIRVPGNQALRWQCDTCHTVFLLSLLRASKFKHSLCPACHGRRVTVPISETEVSSLWANHEDKRFIGSGSHDIYSWSCGIHEWEKSPYHVLLNKGCVECSKEEKREQLEKDRRKLRLEKERAKKAKKKTPYIDPRPLAEPHPVFNVEETREEFSQRCLDYRARRLEQGSISVQDSHRGVYSIPADIELSLSRKYPEVSQYWGDNDRGPDEVYPSSAFRAKWVCVDNPEHTWESYVYTVSKRWDTTGSCCPRCSIYGRSQGEKKLEEFVSSITNDYTVSDRSVIPPYELDIYIESKRIAIEFNGLYWHSEAAGKDRHYHHRKWKMCHDKGIQLITVWEDDWRDRPDIVKSMLAHKLGLSTESRVFARKTEIREIDYRTTAEFLDRHHIQGSATGTLYTALYENDLIVAVSVWRKHQDTVYLDRYATSKRVVGGMGKLLKHAYRWAIDRGASEIVTFADHGVSDGGLYESLGFVLDKELAPDYCYVVDDNRVHKFNYRRKRFENDPLLQWDPNLSERELADVNDIPRIWDHGKSRYKLLLRT